MYKVIIFASTIILHAYSLVGMEEQIVALERQARQQGVVNSAHEDTCKNALLNALNKKKSERQACEQSIGGAHNDGVKGYKELPAFDVKINYFQNRLKLAWLYGIVVSCRFDSNQNACAFLREAQNEMSSYLALQVGFYDTLEYQFAEILGYAFLLNKDAINPLKIKKYSHKDMPDIVAGKY